MRVFVTGGSGFLGSHVAEQLSAAGHEVTALVRRTSDTRFLRSLRGVDLAWGSVEDEASIAAALEGADAVVHSAGLVKARGEREFFEVNSAGTQNVLEAAKRSAPNLRRFVFVSSLAAVGPSDDGRPIPSHTAPRPVTHYGRSKLDAERRVLADKGRLPVTVLRPPMIYGPRDNETFAFFQSVSRRFLPYIGDGRNTLSVVYAADAASACVRAIESDTASGGAYFLDDGEVYVWLDMLREVERAIGRDALVRFSLPLPVVRGAAYASEGMAKLTGKAVMLTRDKLNELSARHWVCDSSDTRRDLGWEPKVKWAEGARLATRWYRDQGWL